MIGLISHVGKVMLRILLNHLTHHIDFILFEEQTGFTAGRSKTEKTTNLRIILGKH